MLRKPVSAFLAFTFLLAATAARAADVLPPQVVRALEIKKEVETANQKDLVALHDDLQLLFKGWDEEDGYGFTVLLKKRLADDAQVFRKIRKLIQQDPKLTKEASWELRTSLVKLIGVEDGNGRVLQSGLLDDAMTMLALPAAKNPLFTSPKELGFAKNQISVAKTLLVYANVIASGENDLTKLADGGIEDKVQMLYRTPFPAGIDKQLIGKTVLSCKQESLLIPNAGYVFGGSNANGGKCRGIDCSAFVSDCVQSRVRMSTLFLDFLYREIVDGENGFTEAEKPIRKELIDEWKLLESKKDFTALDSKAKLQAGDIVTWRPLGHTVIYLSAIPGVENEFVGIEANRADEKTKEGIEVNTFVRNRPGQRTTVLRRVWPKKN